MSVRVYAWLQISKPTKEEVLNKARCYLSLHLPPFLFLQLSSVVTASCSTSFITFIQYFVPFFVHCLHKFCCLEEKKKETQQNRKKRERTVQNWRKRDRERKKKIESVKGGERGRCVTISCSRMLSWTFLSESVSVRVKSTDEAERNRMQAIKCVVVGDGYAINFYFTFTVIS